VILPELALIHAEAVAVALSGFGGEVWELSEARPEAEAPHRGSCVVARFDTPTSFTSSSPEGKTCTCCRTKTLIMTSRR
jgi:hypothetical protein